MSQNQSNMQTTANTNSVLKRPYSKVSDEMRKQIIEALTKGELSILEVSEKFNVKPCTCKAIQLIYEQEGRTQRKRTRKQSVILHSKLKVFIKSNQIQQAIYCNDKKLKMHKDRYVQMNEEMIKQKIVQQAYQQIGELQVELSKETSEAAQQLQIGINSVRSQLKEIQIKGVSQLSDACLSKKENKNLKAACKEDIDRVRCLLNQMELSVEQDPNYRIKMNHLVEETIRQNLMIQQIFPNGVRELSSKIRDFLINL